MGAHLRKRVTCTVQLSLCLPPLGVETLPTLILVAVQAVFIWQNTLCVHAHLRQHVPCTTPYTTYHALSSRTLCAPHLGVEKLYFLILVAVQTVFVESLNEFHACD